MLTFTIYILLFFVLLLLISLGKHWFKNRNKTPFSKIIDDGRFQLLINVTVIVLMVITIHEGQESTNQTISALQREVSRQIDAFGKETLKIIAASDRAVVKTTSEMKNVEQRSSKAKKQEELRILIKEVESNEVMIKRVIDAESDVNITSGKRTIAEKFILNAYEQGYSSKYLVNDDSIKLMAEYYRSLNVANAMLELARRFGTTPMSNEDRYRLISDKNKELIDLCKGQVDNVRRILEILKHEIQ